MAPFRLGNRFLAAEIAGICEHRKWRNWLDLTLYKEFLMSLYHDQNA